MIGRAGGRSENLEGGYKHKNIWLKKEGLLLQCKPGHCNENRYSLCPHSHRENLLLLQGKSALITEKNLLSLQRSCSYCREPVFKTGGSLHTPVPPCTGSQCNSVNKLVPPVLTGIASLYSNVIFLSKRRSRVDRFRNMHGCTTQPLKQPCSPAQAEGYP